MKTQMEDLTEKVFVALGSASMCWSETPKGVFDSTLAKEIGDKLMDDIKEQIDAITSKPWLGNATTLELLNELIARAKVHGYADYKTVESN